jgi:hypothetical protein
MWLNKSRRKQTKLCMFQVCGGMRGNHLCKSCDIERVQKVGGVYTTGGTGNGGVDWMKGVI